MPSQPIQSNVRQGQEAAQPPQVPQTPPVQTAGVQTQATPPAAIQPSSQQTTQPQPSPKKKKWGLWVIIIFGILFVLGAIAYFVFFR